MASYVFRDHGMLRFVFLILLLLLVRSPARAQQVRLGSPAPHPTRPALEPDTLTATFFLDVVRSIAAGLRLANLSQTALPARDVELRLWHGFGLGGVSGVIVRRTGERWVAITVEPAPPRMNPPTHVTYLPVPVADTVNWASAWRSVQAIGLRSLAPVPLRDPGIMVNDGNSYVLEWREGDRYRTAVYANPDYFRTPDDLRMQAIADSLLMRAYPEWGQQSRP